MTNQFAACLDAFKEYRDQYGLNQVRKGTDPEATSENGVLFTVEYLMCLEANIKSMEDYAEYLVETRRVVPVFNSCDWLPGLMRRYPGCLFNPDSMDNHVARLAFDMKHNDGQFAMAMINHDKNQRCDGAEPGSEKWLILAKILGFGRPRYFYNNMHPNLFHWFSWFGRAGGLLGLMDYAARGKTSLFRGFSLWAGTLLSTFIGKDEDMDRWKLGSVVWWAMKHRGWIWKLGASIFQGRLKKKVAGGLKEVYAKYYQSSEHPIVKFTE